MPTIKTSETMIGFLPINIATKNIGSCKKPPRFLNQYWYYPALWGKWFLMMALKTRYVL